jgi:hypothetical protein
VIEMKIAGKLIAVLAFAAAVLTGTAIAKTQHPRMNCVVNGKQQHAASAAACEKMKGKWIPRHSASKAKAKAPASTGHKPQQPAE